MRKSKVLIKELAKDLSQHLRDLLPEQYRPFRDRVLVRTIEVSRSSLIHIPDEQHEGRGLVVAKGDGSYNKHGVRIPIDVEVGDVVVFSRYVGEKVTFADEELRLIKASDLMAVLEV